MFSFSVCLLLALLPGLPPHEGLWGVMWVSTPSLASLVGLPLLAFPIFVGSSPLQARTSSVQAGRKLLTGLQSGDRWTKHAECNCINLVSLETSRNQRVCTALTFRETAGAGTQLGRGEGGLRPPVRKPQIAAALWISQPRAW